jgi:membrane-associated phospholipid phosphatase
MKIADSFLPHGLPSASKPLRLQPRSNSHGSCRRPARTLFCLVLLLLFCHYFSAPLHAADSVFNSTAEIRAELSRVSEQGKLFVKAPVDPYLARSAALAGAFALTYLLDRDIRSGLADAQNGTLETITDVGNAASNPIVHIGVAAALYGAGAVTDQPEVMQLGQELVEALLLADGTSYLLKEAIGRGRPHTGTSNSRYRPFQFRDGYGSLPSMHTASSFAIAHVLASRTESLPVKILCYTAATFAGFSRLYQEKHWATDVLLGAAIGELAGDAVTRYYALEGKLAIVPVSMGGVPSLALIGKF